MADFAAAAGGDGAPHFVVVVVVAMVHSCCIIYLYVHFPYMNIDTAVDPLKVRTVINCISYNLLIKGCAGWCM